MTLPTALCVGAQKAGTTTLSEIFKRHDQVFVPACKEVHYFQNAPNFRRGPAWYAAHFDAARNGQVAMDFTPDYLPSDVCADRIAALCGVNCKIIIVVRHPVDRAFSQYHFYRRLNVERTPDFAQALEADTVRRFSEYEVWHDPKLYVLRSLYFDAITRFRERFSSENVLLLQFEKMIAPQGQKEAVDAIARFLGVAELQLMERQHLNVTLAPSPGLNSRIFRALREAREPMKRLAPGQSYHRLRKWALNRLLKAPEKLNPSLRQELFERYFREDAEKLEAFGVRYT